MFWPEEAIVEDNYLFIGILRYIQTLLPKMDDTDVLQIIVDGSKKEFKATDSMKLLSLAKIVDYQDNHESQKSDESSNESAVSSEATDFESLGKIYSYVFYCFLCHK